MSTGTAPVPARERYRLDRRLGEGGLCVVYRAYDNELDRYVALKLLHPLLVGQDNALQQLKREVLLASRVTHKNVVKVFDFGTLHGNYYVSMQLIEGATLRTLLKDRGRLSPEEGKRLAIEMAAGLEAVHEAGIIHRDLKPENILMDNAGHAYVSDFGLATAHQEAGRWNIEEKRPGTPRYMSPEQRDGAMVDARSDIYAYGLIVHEMVTGVAPDGEEGVQAGVALEGVIRRCLRFQAAERYGSMPEVTAALKQTAGGWKAARARVGRAGWPAAVALLAVAGVALWVRPGGTAEPLSFERIMEARERARTDEEFKAVSRKLGQFLERNGGHLAGRAALAGVETHLAQSTGSSVHLEAARRAVKLASAIGVTQPETQIARARLLLAEGKGREAAELLGRLKTQRAAGADGERLLAMSLLHAGRAGEARQVAEKAVEADPGDWRAQEILGSIHMSAGRLDEGEQAYRAAIAIDRRNPAVYNNLGVLCVRQGRYAESIEWFERALREQPRPATYANVGTAYFYSGKFHLALMMFDKAAALEPGSEPYAGFVAEAARWAGDDRKAAQFLSRATELAGGMVAKGEAGAEVRARLAYYSAKAGDRSRADSLIEQVLGDHPGHAQSLYTRALIHMATRRATAALSDLRRALESGYSAHQALADPNWRPLHGDPRWAELTREYSPAANSGGR